MFDADLAVDFCGEVVRHIQTDFVLGLGKGELLAFLNDHSVCLGVAALFALDNDVLIGLDNVLGGGNHAVHGGQVDFQFGDFISGGILLGVGNRNVHIGLVDDGDIIGGGAGIAGGFLQLLHMCILHR